MVECSRDIDEKTWRWRRWFPLVAVMVVLVRGGDSGGMGAPDLLSGWADLVLPAPDLHVIHGCA
jgi:hypothetical protein